MLYPLNYARSSSVTSPFSLETQNGLAHVRLYFEQTGVSQGSRLTSKLQSPTFRSYILLLDFLHVNSPLNHFSTLKHSTDSVLMGSVSKLESMMGTQTKSKELSQLGRNTDMWLVGFETVQGAAGLSQENI